MSNLTFVASVFLGLSEEEKEAGMIALWASIQWDGNECVDEQITVLETTKLLDHIRGSNLARSIKACRSASLDGSQGVVLKRSDNCDHVVEYKSKKQDNYLLAMRSNIDDFIGNWEPGWIRRSPPTAGACWLRHWRWKCWADNLVGRVSSVDRPPRVNHQSTDCLVHISGTSSEHRLEIFRFRKRPFLAGRSSYSDSERF